MILFLHKSIILLFFQKIIHNSSAENLDDLDIYILRTVMPALSSGLAGSLSQGEKEVS